MLTDPSFCTERRVCGINRSSAEPPYLNGCYSEHIILATGTNLFLVDKNIDPAVLVTTSCSGATIANAFDLAPCKLGDTVVVQDPGPLGIFAVAFAKAHEASHIIMIGGSPERMSLCREFEATHLINRNETTVAERREAVLNLIHGRGADLVLEAVGYPDALAEGLELVQFREASWLKLQ